MDSEILLARENEFKKLNMQLEKKSENLLKRIENAVEKRDIFSDFLNNSTLTEKRSHKRGFTKDNLRSKTENQIQKDDLNLEHRDLEVKERNEFKNGMHEKLHTDDWLERKCDCINKKNNDLEFLYAFVSVNVKNNVLPPSFLKDKVTVESVCKFMSAKVNLMQEQINNVQAAIDKKAKQYDKHMIQLAEYEAERLSLLNRDNNMKSEIADIKAKYSVMQNKLNDKERLYKEQRSVTDRLTNDLKQIKSRNTSVEARCASQEEVIATLKQQLETAKITEKELRESSRNISSSQQNAISRLEARVKALITTVDKQMALIHNLRKQNVMLQTEGALRAFEKEYCDFLKQDM
ncbi:unnamed protein product [Danaus chrysippus]|uniref:(African queen) hypothetical protein n=1 Tax=Danaus chrysippus TaxID=151541 RepID=A0A8J2W5W3_9NEOP|nr:unnamed protein product [Danaus chrysippus]